MFFPLLFNMKAIVLAAGYATRLHPLTINTSKCLLEVAGRPILDHIVEKLNELDLDEIIVVTNARFYKDFLDWLPSAETKIPIKILNDGSTCNENRLGGIADMLLAAEKFPADEHMFIAGDNLFDFSLKEFYNKAIQLKKPLIGVYDIGSIDKARNFGVVQLENNKIVSFEEKPSMPKSTLVATLIYAIPNAKFYLQEYLQNNSAKDAPGHFIKWLLNKTPCFAYKFEGKWCDIGTKEALEEARLNF